MDGQSLNYTNSHKTFSSLAGQPDMVIFMFYPFIYLFIFFSNEFVNALGIDSGYITYVHRCHPYFE